MDDPAVAADQFATRERLLDAAETVIGNVGVEAASLRRINAAAGANVAAIHYHFGSKQALVKAALARRMDQMGERRHQLLDALDTEHPSPLDVARAVIAPFVGFVYGEGQTEYLRFLVMLHKAGGEWSSAMMEAFLPQAERVDALYTAALPGLPQETMHARRLVAAHTMWEVLADMRTFFGRDLLEGAAVDALAQIVVSILTLPNHPVDTSVDAGSHSDAVPGGDRQK